MPKLFTRLWNAFLNRDPTAYVDYQIGSSSSYMPYRSTMHFGIERTIMASICNRIAMDVSSVTFQHVVLDENGRFKEVVDSGLNRCLTLRSNIDQTANAFKQDIVMSMLDEGAVAVVPVDTENDPMKDSEYEILSVRTGKIVQWYPSHVMVSMYNDRTGLREEIVLPKQMVAIIENPLYPVMNEPNSTYRRLTSKLGMLDVADQNTASGKLDLIIQLPYTVRNDITRNRAEKRRKDLEEQLATSKYGVLYTDGTEKITQLNRAVENNLLTQVEYLTRTLYAQTGMTEGILNGTASETELTNYYNRIIEPIASAICIELASKFLTDEDRKNNQTIFFFRDPLKMLPTYRVAEMADKLTRNEIMTSNEFRQILGMKTSSDPNADELRNKNLPKAEDDNGGDSPNEEV